MTLDLGSIRRTAEGIARDAGAVVMRYYNEGFKQTTKSSSIDIQTEADEAAEQIIVDALESHFPQHHIVGEEGGGRGAAIDSAAYRWYVDPIDGTTNFANGIPVFAISLALTDSNMQPLVGVVYNPATDELFSAAQGHGATLNDAAIHVSAETTLNGAVLASGFPYDKHTDPDNNVAEWGRFLVRSRGLRRMGSAALDCAFVAAGRFDGYWEAKLNPWDVLAGLLCVTEAGGRVTDYTGATPDDLVTRARLVASNGHIHDAMVDVLRGA